MRLRRRLRPAVLGLALLALLTGAEPTFAETCSADSFGDAVDASAAELRAFSAETQPKLKQKLAALRDARKWTEPDYESKGLATVHDQKLDAFDSEAGELLSRIDTLGSPEASDAAATSCANLEELKSASAKLMSVMRAKSSYLISKLDREIAAAPVAKPDEVAKSDAPADRLAGFSPPDNSNALPAADPTDALSPLRRADPAPKAQPKATEQPKASEQPSAPAQSAPAEPPKTAEAPKAPEPARAPETPKPADAPAVAEAGKPASPPSAQPTHPGQHTAPQHTHPSPDTTQKESDKTSSWSTTTAQAVIPPPPLRHPPGDQGPPAYDPPAPGDPPGMPYAPPPGEPGDDASDPQAFDTEGGGYTIDEIREATRGFFGTISTSLASVIEHAFQKGGRPTAYVLGNEGGGAFLAGLRYGEGTLYLRSGGSQKVYWHGPSIGYDVGAEGSRTLFLIYQLEEPKSLFRRFTGVDGSAYLVGGVGMTLLKGGPVMMAPIRSGIGLRLGASIGYVRFTPRPTWNPF